MVIIYIFDLCKIVRGSSWPKRVNSIVDYFGFTDIRAAFDNGINYLPLFNNRLRNQLIQDWKASKDNYP